MKPIPRLETKRLVLRSCRAPCNRLEFGCFSRRPDKRHRQPRELDDLPSAVLHGAGRVVAAGRDAGKLDKLVRLAGKAVVPVALSGD